MPRVGRDGSSPDLGFQIRPKKASSARVKPPHDDPSRGGDLDRRRVRCGPGRRTSVKSATFPRMRVSVTGIRVGAALLVLWLQNVIGALSQVAEIVTGVTRMSLSPSVAR